MTLWSGWASWTRIDPTSCGFTITTRIGPWTVDEGFEDMRDAYASEIAYTDAQFGRLLDGLPKRDRERLVVMTVDHGEGLGEHGENTHGMLAYDGTLHVPMIMEGVGVPAGAVTDSYVRHVDITPTVLAAVGLEIPEDLDGGDLRDLEALEARNDTVHGYFEAHSGRLSHGWSNLEGVRTARWKYTAMPEPVELYDLVLDRKEINNAAARDAETTAKMRALHEQIRASAKEISKQLGSTELDPEQMQALAALGYVQAPTPDEVDVDADPRKLISMHDWIEGARSAAMQGDEERAIEILEMLRPNRAVRSLALHSLAAVYEHIGRFDEAADAYAEYIDVTGGADAMSGLARSLVRAKRYEEADEALSAWDSDSTQLSVLHATVLARLDRGDDARKLLDEAFAEKGQARARRRARAQLVITLAPYDTAVEEMRELYDEDTEDPVLTSQLGFLMAVWAREGNEEEARRLLEAAVEMKEDDPAIGANLGWGLYRLGALGEAREALEKLLELEPDAHMERSRLAHVLAEQGELEPALIQIRRAMASFPGAEWAGSAKELHEDLVERLKKARAAEGDKEPAAPAAEKEVTP